MYRIFRSLDRAADCLLASTLAIASDELPQLDQSKAKTFRKLDGSKEVARTTMEPRARAQRFKTSGTGIE